MKNMSKKDQIRGLRKALANRKTSKQFLPSLRKRLAKLTACILFAFAALSARAQAPVSIVPTQQVLAAAGTLCSGTQQTFNVNNRNQTQHYANFVGSGVTNLVMQIQGLDLAGNVYVISDTATSAIPINGINPSLTGTGYFPTVRVALTCQPTSATFTLNYAGGQATSNVNVGSYQVTQQDKTISSLAPAGSGYNTPLFETPFGNSYGVMYFLFVGAGSGPSGSTIALACENQNGTATNSGSLTFNLSTSITTVQSFAVPPMPCPHVQATFTSGGANSDTYDWDYVFMPPGASVANSYTHVTGTTATVVKAGSGVVHSVVVGTPAAGTISLFDLASGSCTGTPATNVVSVITATTTFPSAPEIYDVQFINGICIKASAAMDFTVSYQ
jgi:hypothetical protein